MGNLGNSGNVIVNPKTLYLVLRESRLQLLFIECETEAKLFCVLSPLKFILFSHFFWTVKNSATVGINSSDL